MPSVAELRRRASQRLGYVLFIEGIEYAWTDLDDLVGTAWIGTEYGPRTVVRGLTVPESWEEAVEIRDGGMLETDEVAFGLVDFDELVVGLIGSQRDTQGQDQLGEHLSPLDKTCPAQLQGIGTSVTVDMHNRFVGLERIGPDGQRGWFWCLPVEKRDRLRRDHPVAEFSDSVQGDLSLPPIFVTDDPIQFAGRRVALFEVTRDDDGTWPSWRETYEGGGLVFMGEMLDEGELAGVREWRIRCSGFDSMFRKPLNSTKPDIGFEVQGKVALEPEQRGIAVWFTRESEGGSSFELELHDGCFFTDGSGNPRGHFSASDDTVDEIIAHIASQVEIARDGLSGSEDSTDGDAPYADDPGNSSGSARWATFTKTAATIRVSKGTSGAPLWGTMFICMHRAAWLAAGWDPEQAPYRDRNTAEYLDMYPVYNQELHATGHGTKYTPGDDYWVGIFSTWPGGDTWPPPHSERANGGANRFYAPTFPGGAFYLRAQAQQVVPITQGPGPYMEGIAARAPSLYAKINGQQTTAAGYWVFKGVRRTDVEAEDGEDYVQVGLCSWVQDSTGRIAIDGDGFGALYVEAWCDPRTFGYDFKKLEGDWGFSMIQEERLTAYPLGVVGGLSPNEPDNVFWAVGRMLVGTGTSPATEVEGLNGIPYAKLNGYFGDYEGFDMALGIPYEHVDIGSLVTCNDAMPGPGLQRGRYAKVGQIDAEELLKQFMSSRGLAMGLRRGEFGPRLFFWRIFGPWDPDEVVASINANEGDVVGNREQARTLIAKQGIRWKAPVDEWKISYSEEPIEGKMFGDLIAKSQDPEARGRNGKVSASQVDGGLVPDSLWRVTPSWGYWRGDWRSLMAREGAAFYAKRHFPITVEIRRTIDIGAGDLVFYTDDLPADTDGTYGLSSRLARVLRVRRRTHASSYEVTLLVQAEPLDRVRYWAPLVRPWGHDSDINSAGSGWVYCAKPGVIHWEHGNWAGHGGTRSDVAGLAEPSWSSTGGTAKVAIDQSFDGKTWGNRVVASVLDVDPIDNKVQIEIVSGVLLRDTEKLMTLLPIDQQDANSWTREVYAPYTDNAGTHDGAAGWRFNG